jgi:glycine cleavage system aminomethyltransferase T
MLERGIALAFLPPTIAPGESVTIDQRGTLAPGIVVKPPFWSR